MNATTRIAEAGIKFQVGQVVTIPFYPTNIEVVVEDNQYVILNAYDLSVEDVATDRETAESMATELGDGQGYIAVRVTTKGQEVMQYWRDIVADCWSVNP